MQPCAGHVQAGKSNWVRTIEIRLLIEKGPIQLADVLAMDKSNVGAAPRLFCDLLKIYTLPNHTITIGVCILETTPWLIIWWRR
jgi:hypothetical protein